jgi:hypothetical protein
VIAVGNRLVTAAGAVDMARFMAAALMVRCAAVGIVAGHLDHVLIDMTFVRVVEVTIVQIVHVVVVTHGGVAARRPMLVSMLRVGRRGAVGHHVSSFPCPGSADIAVRSSAAWSITLRTNGKMCSSASV